jgi:hypothetical protein
MRKLECNIEMDLKEMQYEGTDGIELVQDTTQ